MTKYWKLFRLASVFLVIFCCLPHFAAAQPPPDPESDPDAPIDGGVSLLIAAGIGYGLKKIRDRKKNTTTLYKRQES